MGAFNTVFQSTGGGPSPTPDTDTVTAYLYAVNESNAVQSVLCSARLDDKPTGTGFGYVPNIVEKFTASNGYFDFPAHKGGKYTLIVGGKTHTVLIPTDATDPYPLDNTITQFRTRS